jgi:phosphatidylserine/phosphatidylglycerophosphate/cardiolipin synthase-like enzyme
MRYDAEMRFWSLKCFLILFCLLTLSAQAFGRSKKGQNKIINAVNEAVNAALVQPPKDQEVCFSPDEPCDIKLIKFIDSAEKSLEIAVFDVTLDSFVHHVLVKSKKIPVRVLVDKRQGKGEHSLVGTLVKGGVSVRYGKQRGIMHNKFTIVDGKAIETGSFNYTNNASFNNNENQIYLWNSNIVDRYKKRFEEIWSVGTPVSKQKD